MHAPSRKGGVDSLRRALCNRKGDDTAALDTLVLHGDCGNGSESSAQLCRKGCNAPIDSRQPPAKGVLDGDAKADFGGGVCLPVFEAPSVRPQFIAVSSSPGGSVQVQQGWLQLVEHLAPHVE